MSRSSLSHAGVGMRAGLLVLGGVLVVAAGVALAVGHGRPGWSRAVAFAATITALGTCGGWLASRWPSASPAAAVGGALAATLLRLLPPLAGLAWLGTGGTDLRQAGAGGLLVVFYLTALATAVFLDMIGAASATPGSPAAGRTRTGN
jgi:hypothetical protein